MRIALGIEYNGANYHGWQIQNNLSTVQLQIENALSKIADTQVKVICAGRTDVGVHALEQVVHFDTDAIRPMYAWLLGVNSHLPPDIRVHWVKEVDENFHARYSAKSRQYRYLIYNNKTNSANLFQKVTWIRQPLDAKLMHEAGQYLIGEHDFSSFRAAECQSRSANRNITLLKVSRQNKLIIIDIAANAFLQHMVRNIAGVLIAIGVGKKPSIWAKEVLAAKDRKIGDVTAPAEGLYLMKILY